MRYPLLTTSLHPLHFQPLDAVQQHSAYCQTSNIILLMLIPWLSSFTSDSTQIIHLYTHFIAASLTVPASMFALKLPPFFLALSYYLYLSSYFPMFLPNFSFFLLSLFLTSSNPIISFSISRLAIAPLSIYIIFCNHLTCWIRTSSQERYLLFPGNPFLTIVTFSQQHQSWRMDKIANSLLRISLFFKKGTRSMQYITFRERKIGSCARMMAMIQNAY